MFEVGKQRVGANKTIGALIPTYPTVGWKTHLLMSIDICHWIKVYLLHKQEYDIFYVQE